MNQRRGWHGIGLGVMAWVVSTGLAATPAHAQEWPDKPITIVSPYGPGGPNDTSIRMIAEGLQARLGERIVVNNRAGAGTRIGNESVAQSAPDGYTLLWAAAPFAITASAGIQTRYDIDKDFVKVGPSVIGPIFLTVSGDSPVKSVAEFVAMARQKPEGVAFASPGIGSGPHLTSELLAHTAGFKALNVHYKGDAAAYVDLMGGRADAALTSITFALPHVQSGRLRVLAVASDARSPVFPDAPTFAEAGLPQVVGYGWFGLMAPAGTPQPIVQRLNREVSEILSDPAMEKKLMAAGLEGRPGTSAEFSAFVQDEVVKWRDLLQKTGIQLE